MCRIEGGAESEQLEISHWTRFRGYYSQAVLALRLWIYHPLIVVAQIGDRTFLAARPIEDADALPMAQ